MKRIQFIFFILSTSFVLYAQTPNAFRYQTLLRDNRGNPVTDQLVSLKFIIVPEGGTEVYSEEHSIQSGPTGLINLAIGEGGNPSGSLADVDWDADPYLLDVYMDSKGGTSYELMNSIRLVSVPYALHAGSADRVDNQEGRVGIGTDDPKAAMDVNGEIRFNGYCIDQGKFGDGQTYLSDDLDNRYTIYFNKKFSRPPMVSFSLECILTPNCSGLRSTSEQVTQVNEDRFTVFWKDSSSYSGIAYINWIAIGPCETIDYTAGEFIDERDGQSYMYIELNDRVWMAENLNYCTPEGSWYYNDDSTVHAEDYGRLYNRETAQEVCPAGWHLPSQTEYSELQNFLQGGPGVGTKLKEIGTTYWKNYASDPPVIGKNTSRFSARGAGERTTDGNFRHLRETAYFWTSTEAPNSNIYPFQLYYSSASASLYGYNESNKARGMSVRCIKD